MVKRRNNGHRPGNRGQAMLETIILVAFIGLVVGFSLRALSGAFGQRQSDLRTYYSMPGP